MSAPSPPEPVNVAEFERLARERLGAGAYGYFAGGAGDERTLRDNVAAFERWQLMPRMLVDVSEVTTASTVLGQELSMPVLVAPVAFQRLAHPDGEVAMARAAAEAGTVMCLSTLATSRPSELASAVPGSPRWFQLYCFRDRGVTRALAEEAAESGCSAIVLTVDAPRPGLRERDLRTGFAIPPEITVPSLEAVVGGRSPIRIHDALAQVDPTLSWRDLEALASELELPVLVKGILSPADARLAVEHGASGVIVSNHGGRQLDATPASIDALPEVVEAVEGAVEVLMDGGIRRGSDVACALGLGASAVLVGRPALWGLAAAGQEGAGRVLEMLRFELELTLSLCGCSSPAAMSSEHVRRAP